MTTATLPERTPTDTTPPWLCDCSLSDRILCRLREERALLADLAESPDGPDADVLRFDLGYAERHTDALIGLGRAETRQ